ncbi:hypothetical protein ASG73_00910 [Janibacter sp. Soil728]|uniref:carbon-nitrogen family hydrolase n=1 Tax=Janibacter sp. Soil728 TaxID=1736393 RepID=UPI0006FC05D4|nr:carbon-nitrogen family hydrolase [Janibacter sp. Soil728]KRE38960.1 hypothetical protein ASG73_00910 [Janibacter sp. Soil728]
MSTDLKVAAIQVAHVDDEDPDARWARTSELVRAHRHHDLIVLPELWSNGAFSPAGWDESAEPLDGPHVQRLADLARELGVTLHGGSFIERSIEAGADGRHLWNTSVVLGPDGSLRAVYRKIHRFGFGEGEPLLLEAGSELATFDMGGTTIGLATCYDLRFPELFRAYVDHGVEVFLVPASWPDARREHWQLLGRARALENQAWVVQVNVTGAHGGLDMGGHSQVVAPMGRVVGSLDRDESCLSAVLDLEVLRAARDNFPVLADRRVGRLDRGGVRT